MHGSSSTCLSIGTPFDKNSRIDFALGGLFDEYRSSGVGGRQAMAMAADRVVQLCSHSASAIREDMARIETGALTYRSEGDEDVSPDQLARMRAVLSCLQEIIDGCGCECT
jgi:hypothetical protein